MKRPSTAAAAATAAASAAVSLANKRGRTAGVAAVKASTSRGTAMINNGAGTMPVDAPAPHGGTRYSLLTDPPDAAATFWVDSHDGSRGADGGYAFRDAPAFRPTLSPAECLRLGVFGGCYFNSRGGKPGIFGRDVAVDATELPAAWLEGLPPSNYLSRRCLPPRDSNPRMPGRQATPPLADRQASPL